MTGTESRQHMDDEIRRELFGPLATDRNRGVPIDLSGTLTFKDWKSFDQVWHDSSTGEEVIRDMEPLRRYGVGLLFPTGTVNSDSLYGATGLPSDDVERDVDGAVVTDQSKSPKVDAPSDSDDFDLSETNTFQQSALGISARLRVQVGQALQIKIDYARYRAVKVRVEDSTRTIWVRSPVQLLAEITHEVASGAGGVVTVPTRLMNGSDPFPPILRVFARPTVGDTAETIMLTTVMENRSPGAGSGATMFQCGLRLSVSNGARIESYPEMPPIGGAMEEDESIDLLYREKRSFAIGHGCAATWGNIVDRAAEWVAADPLPSFELPSLTPDIMVNGAPLQVSMSELANSTDVGNHQLIRVVDEYRTWIDHQEEKAPDLEGRYQSAAGRHIFLCREALTRMEEGLEFLETRPLARRAFRLANEAMLYQQLRSRLARREASVGRDGTIQIEGAHPDPTPQASDGLWRPFQIAFLLATVPEIIDPTHQRRNLVDLIFFPTGGGKTEAYLGAAALSMFARRLREPSDAGTDVLMRYTLRLLTAQQFLRASALICVMEDIRSKNHDLGSEAFSIGIWLGGSTTPNNWKSAVEAHARLAKDPRADNPFLLLACPWCSCQFGSVSSSNGRSSSQLLGYVRVGPKVLFLCPDPKCRFSSGAGLPVHVVDEDIYASRPTFVIGTVDKFAMLAWTPAARAIFGLSRSGNRVLSPPSLIVQDELHLISGPLGSMVGLYETIIEDLCTAGKIKPKIIASTATIRRYERQVRDLYGRTEVRLFPPHGLTEGQSFFAETARDADGVQRDGRRYLGVMSPSLGSIQTVQVRVAAATLQGALGLDPDDRDPYWTNLNFLNSLRELGNTVSLIQSDIPDYLTGIRRRQALPPNAVRWPGRTMELTSRRKSDEITRAIDELGTAYPDPRAVDICLASNIIEVGVDIDRLSLMTIVGQPKTTAQYIQVSGRVGRKWSERPGLVVTIYGAAKPRDRSHYERFRSYHERLYAAVEPTSVTPFALPVLTRGLHGALLSRIRQVGEQDMMPDPFPGGGFDNARDLLRERAVQVDPDEIDAFDTVAGQRRREWELGERTAWSANLRGGDPAQGLMRFAGSAVLPGARQAITWDVPTSMRSVDAECQLSITSAYVEQDVRAAAGGEA